MRQNLSSPLGVAQDGANQTQVLQTTFKGDEAVIHEVAEEDVPDEQHEQRKRQSYFAKEQEENESPSRAHSKASNSRGRASLRNSANKSKSGTNNQISRQHSVLSEKPP